MIYFDYNASTPVAPEVRDKINNYYKFNSTGNASNINSNLGKRTANIVTESKKVFKKIISSNTINEIIFTSGATESINTAIISSVLTKNKKQNVILTTRIEHKSILSTCKFTERFGVKTEYVDIDSDGSINIESLKDKIDDNTLMFATHHVNNEIGTIQPLVEIGKICNNRIFFLVDAAQSLGKIPINVQKCNISYLSGSSHKIYGPQGIGILYIHNELLRSFVPLIHGGGQQGNIRSGTLNFVGIIGFTKAIELSLEKMMDDEKYVCNLKDIFLSELSKHNIKYLINGNATNRIYGNLNLRFVGVDADYLLLSCPNITMSKGSACESDSITPSHVLRAIGMLDKDINECLRISFGRYTTEQEIIESVCFISNSINNYFQGKAKV